MLRLRQRVGAPAVVAGLTGCVQLPFFDRWFSPMDEGHMLLFADLVTKGSDLYRDMTIYPLPGAFYALALAFSLFEPSILLSRWIVMTEFCVFVALVYSLMRQVVSARYAALAVGLLWIYRVWAFPHWQMYNYSTTALLLVVASLVALLAFFRSRRLRTLAIAGAIFGLGVFCKQDYGAVAMLTASVALLVYARTTPDTPAGPLFAAFFLPAASIGALAGLHLLVQGQLDFVVQMTVLKHFVGLSSYEYQAFPPLFPLFQQDPALRDLVGIHNNFPTIVTMADWHAAMESHLYTRTALYDTAVKLYIYGPFLLIAGGGARVWRRRTALREPESRQAALAELVLFCFAASAVALSHLYRPQDYVHFAVLYWPLVCLVVVYAHAALSGRRSATGVVALLLLLPAGTAIAYTGRLAWQFRAMHSERLPGDRGGIYAKPGQVRMLGELVSYLHRHTEPDERVAVLPYFSIAHFLAERRGPHAASYILWPFAEYPDRDRRIIDAMEATNTDTVIYNFTQFPNFPPVPEYAPELYAYLVEHFETDRVFNDAALGFKLAALRRRSPAREGEPLLPELALGRLRVEPLRGAARSITAEERDRYLAAEVWPFREVLALRPTAGGETVLGVEFDVPEGALLRTAVGVHPDAWFRYPPAWVRFKVAVHSEGRRDVLFEKTLDPHQVLEDRGWFAVEVSLAHFAGRTIEIELSTASASRAGETLLMGGFGAPRVGSLDRP